MSSLYLTPGKIALLALVELYTNSRFPNASVLPVLTFIIRHLVSPQDSSTFLLTLDSIKACTLSHASTIVGRSIYDLLLKRLWEINSFDALHSFFDDISSLVVDPHDGQAEYTREPGERGMMSKTSILGCFIRRACLEYTRLQFNDAVQLWRSLVEFRAPTLAQWKKRNPGAGQMGFDVNVAGMAKGDLLVEKVYPGLGKGESKGWGVSTDDVDRLLEFQVDVMQRMGSRVPDEVREQLKAMVEGGVAVPSLMHYVEFLNSWRAGDYPGSFDNLHRYFDYTMHSRDRTFYQYALLNLSILQADFGCYRESILAMQETINTARENRDLACLNFSLSWLYHFHKAHPRDCPSVIASRMERDSLLFLKTKAKESGMHHLHSMAHLSEAKQLLLSGDSIPAAFESLTRSSHLNVTKNIVNATGSQLLLASSLWSRLGVAHLATTSCALFLAKHTTTSPLEDTAKAICRRSLLLAARGRLPDALALIDTVPAPSLRSLKLAQYWSAHRGLIQLQRALHAGRLAAARLLLAQLEALPHLDPDCAFDVAALKIELLHREGNHSRALTALDALAARLPDAADIQQRVRLLLLRAAGLQAAGRPRRGLTAAVAACDAAWKARLMPALFEAYALLAGALVELGECAAADAMVDAVMPHVLECEDAGLAARCFGVLADAQVGLAGGEAGKARARRLHRAVEYCERAFAEYSKLGDVANMKTVVSRKARIQDFLGDRELRDDTVKRYRALEKGVAT